MDVESLKSTHLALFQQDTQSVIHVFAHQDTRSAVPVIVVAELASAISPLATISSPLDHLPPPRSCPNSQKREPHPYLCTDLFLVYWTS